MSFNSWASVSPAVVGNLNSHVSLTLLFAFFFASESSFYPPLVLHFFLRRKGSILHPRVYLICPLVSDGSAIPSQGHYPLAGSLAHGSMLASLEVASQPSLISLSLGAHSQSCGLPCCLYNFS